MLYQYTKFNFLEYFIKFKEVQVYPISSLISKSEYKMDNGHSGKNVFLQSKSTLKK